MDFGKIIASWFIIAIFASDLGIRHCKDIADPDDVSDSEEDETPLFHEIIATTGSLISLKCQTTHNENYDELIWWRNDSSQPVVFKSDLVFNVSTEYKKRIVLEDKDLVLRQCLAEDDAFYYCETKKNGDVQEGRFTKVTIQEKPHCLGTLSQLLVLNGSIAHLPCIVRGSPEPEISWRKNGYKLGENDHISKTDKGLTIRNVQVEDKGKYQVTLTNKLGSYIHPMELTVKTIDDVEPSNYKNVIEHNPITIECGENPIKPGDSVSWSNAQYNDLTSVPRFTVDEKGALHINETLRTDSGFFTCASTRADDRGGFFTYTTNVYVNVEYIPTILSIKKHVLVYLGDNAELQCNAIGQPGIYHRWLQPNGAVIRNEGRFRIASNGSLLISKVELKDVKNYTCAPYNDIGDGKHGYSALVILIPPSFMTKKSKTNYQLEVGEKVILDCSASGIPEPNITWKRFNKKGEEVSINKDAIKKRVGLLVINEVKVSDVGKYTCHVESPAGKMNRTISIEKVRGKPDPPTDFSVHTRNNVAFVTWRPSYDGGSKQNFEVWYRATSLTDYQWEQKTSPYGAGNTEITLLGPYVTSSGKAVTFYFSVRARNNEGYSEFTEVMEVGRRNSGQDNGKVLKQPISTKPLAPSNFVLNMTDSGYQLNWNIIETPGRPSYEKISIQYREANATNSWKIFNLQNTRMRRAISKSDGVFIKADDISDAKHPLEFRISAVSANGAMSPPKTPVSVTVTGMPGGPASDKKTNEDKDITPPIVLGVIFGIFVIVLLVTFAVIVYCYCRRKKGRYQARKNQKKSVEYNKKNGIDIEAISLEDTENKKLLDNGFDSPRKFHFRTCPALQLGKFTNNHDYEDGTKTEDVHALLEPHVKEELVCTCKNKKKYLTLNSQEIKKIKKDSKGLFKSSSTPDIFLTSDNEKASSIDPSELLDEEQYDISDLEKDDVTDLKTKKSTLNRSKFKDSYDQFCKPITTKGGRLNSNKSSNNDKTEVDKNLLSQQEEQQEINDNSSENSATESERPHDGKSSGYGDGSNTTSDSESIQDKQLLLKPATLKFKNEYSKRDLGYISDISTRSSPLDHVTKHKQQLKNNISKNKNYFSDDEYERPRAPPSYKQAIDDIERMSEINEHMSEINEITDSEDMYDQLIAMEKKLGIELDDSLDSDLNTQGIIKPPRNTHLPPTRTYNNNNTESGYMSDIGFNRDRYSDREKSDRCAKLLNEFKINRNRASETTDDEVPIHPPTDRSRSVMDNIINEEPRVPPVLRRSNSAGSSSVYNEWLV